MDDIKKWPRYMVERGFSMSKDAPIMWAWLECNGDIMLFRSEDHANAVATGLRLGDWSARVTKVIIKKA